MFSSLRKVLKSFKDDRKRLFSLIFLSLLTNLVFILYIDMVKRIFNSAIAHNSGKTLLWVLLGGLILLADIFLSRSLLLGQKRLYSSIITRLRSAFYQQVNRLPLPTLESYLNADLLTRFTDDITGVASFFSEGLITVISNLVLFLLFFTYLALNDWRLVLVILALVPFIFLLMKRFGSRLRHEAHCYQRELSGLNTQAKDIFEYLLDIKALAREKFFLNRYKQQEDVLVRHELQRILYNNIIWIGGIAAYYVIYLFFFGIGGYLAYRGILEFGLLVGLFLMIDRLVDLLMGFPQMLSSLYEVQPKIERVYAILENHQPVQESGKIQTIAEESLAVDLQNLSYSYSDNPALRNVSLQIRRGERVAIVGESGCGKSTLLKLLTGYDERYQGKIRILGPELRDWAREALLKHISYSPQQPFLVSRSIRENVNLFTEGISENKLKEYTRLVALDVDINTLEQQYDTPLQNGGKNLSGGQKQRLGLMLSLLKPANIYLIDESFSALDPTMTQTILQQVFASTKETLIVINHKMYNEFMSSFDRIIVMDEGQIVGEGTHKELLSNEVYWTLYTKSVQARKEESACL